MALASRRSQMVLILKGIFPGKNVDGLFSAPNGQRIASPQLRFESFYCGVESLSNSIFRELESTCDLTFVEPLFFQLEDLREFLNRCLRSPRLTPRNKRHQCHVLSTLAVRAPLQRDTPDNAFILLPELPIAK